MNGLEGLFLFFYRPRRRSSYRSITRTSSSAFWGGARSFGGQGAQKAGAGQSGPLFSASMVLPAPTRTCLDTLPIPLDRGRSRLGLGGGLMGELLKLRKEAGPGRVVDWIGLGRPTRYRMGGLLARLDVLPD